MSSGDNQTARLVPQMKRVETLPLQNPYQMLIYSSMQRQRMHNLIRELIAQNQLLKMREFWNRRLLLLKCLKDPRQRQNPRCQPNCVIHPYIPGRAEVNPLPLANRQARKRRRKLRKKRKEGKIAGAV